ncbi:JAB1/Mov34/MPN/PAD-1 ubiquitin protease-domain-containing protein [Dunaliella salina]|uniref:JAB1/Mov34/MPN/PAD-1 ubiquitin protease-domain-containing protein n=1 Tax=Dunaliella salina TaxID=3046 RepID=A0ABQ7GRV4_DUNSA|nr:JAB1/Mov34/MPN/PAD-1 ubiquitin protease-domain-containing protein [Dunaliella salina]|eukprot:KAF5837344.1 JAB1/Mov34/MPN/PAD-1 ubiquitin protease-domain-containing protein [Dunaliella salina]
MGLLLGDCKEDGSGALVSRIWMAYPQIRTDRRKDRVESSPEQMARCCAHAERLSRETGVPTRVVGWYHSHPHITVLPSHVDVRTQAMYQMLDPGFAGLIFSVFNSDPVSKTGQIQLTAFQSVPAAGGGGALQSPMASGDFAGMDDALKAAIKASTASAQASAPDAMVRKEVPLVVAPGSSPTERSLHDYSVLHRVLDKEEKEAYTAAMKAVQGR